MARLVPPAVLQRSKQPYRAPDGKCFLDPHPKSALPPYVDELLSPERIKQDGIFQPEAVAHLVRKFRQGGAIGVKDNMALVGILSTQLLIDQFVRNFPLRAARATLDLPSPSGNGAESILPSPACRCGTSGRWAGGEGRGKFIVTSQPNSTNMPFSGASVQP